MKKFLLNAGIYACKISTAILISMLIYMLSGCTMQFKAKEIELEGHSYTEYGFEKFAWTKPTPKPTKPAD